ncbi:MAG: glycosyltransferase family 4 protein [Deltaproteobacteria bacterium]|uniref:Glycosyltransferase family 4 protein n=1 Tax=Candidatus Desulfacyla euxinica TaxID=2841693 RepID=A0A8J6T9J3_9DELT|nr:glycosyltransferase family 4 protein [Candidatus Desulfacyla euxinica]MBL7218023.1 glycosyltransferase family 4 protein [Desulfobacteraceae bacterium]
MNKVVHIITRLDMGGSAQNTSLTCRELIRKYEMVLVYGLSFESRMTEQEKESVDRGIKESVEKCVRVIATPSLIRRISPLQDLKALFSLWRLFIRERPFIVHTHTSKAGILGRLAAKLAGVPIIIHTPHGHVFYGHFGPLVSKCFLFTERVMARITDQMVALTQTEKNDYVALSVFSPEKVATIHSGVDVDRFMNVQVNIAEKKRMLGLNSKGLLVGTVGWLLPIKGPMHLLKAMPYVWENHPETSLIFVGKGDLEKGLKEEARRMGVSDKVIFLGWRDDIPEIMETIDVFVLPSLNEGMGRVLVEAMAAGKPVVASRVGGILDLVKEGQNGFLAEPGDEKGLAIAIKKLLEDKKMRDEMGKRGREMAQGFSVEKMIEKIDVLYESLLHY